MSEGADLIQKTLLILKPDVIQRGLVGEIVQRIERVGLKIVGMKMMMPDREHFYKHYEEIGEMISRRGEDAFNYNLKYMTSSPVIAMVVEGVEAVDVLKKITGTTESKMAEAGTIRGDYSHMSFAYSGAQGIGVPNLVHRSGSLEEAEKEIALWFDDEELFQYKALNDAYMR